MLKKIFAVAAIALLSVGVIHPGCGTRWQPDSDDAEEFIASLKFQSGKIDLPNGVATLDLPRALLPESRRFEPCAGGMPGAIARRHGTLGMIFPPMKAVEPDWLGHRHHL